MKTPARRLTPAAAAGGAVALLISGEDIDALACALAASCLNGELDAAEFLGGAVFDAGETLGAHPNAQLLARLLGLSIEALAGGAE